MEAVEEEEEGGTSSKRLETQPKKVTLNDSATKPNDIVKTQRQQLALFREKSRLILEKNSTLDSSIAVKDMENTKRKDYLADLVDYQTRKERIYMVTISYWIVSVLLGLVAMTLWTKTTELGMFIIWLVLLASNIVLVVAHKLYDRSMKKLMIEKYGDREDTRTDMEAELQKV